MAAEDARRLLVIAGTRPEAIKIAPLLLDAAARPRLHATVLATGQQAERFDAALAEFGLAAARRLPPLRYDPDPDILVARMVDALIPAVRDAAPDLVLVQGDTGSALAGAIAARQCGVPIGHVEAGLRSGNLDSPWPEERNRIAVDALAALLFAPTARAAAALATEPAVRGRVHLTGNTGIDALLWMRGRLPAPAPSCGRRSILLTCHRRESFGAGIERICTAALRLASRGDVRILCPVHDNPAVGGTVRDRLGNHPAITLTSGLGYRELVAAMVEAELILTDSGGIQEEAPAIGRPTLVLRDVTERAEGIESGNLRLVGTDADAIVAAATGLLDDRDAYAAMGRPAFPFGAGDAAARILDHVEAYLGGGVRPPHRLRSGRFAIMADAPSGV